jgi:hypothetical protein
MLCDEQPSNEEFMNFLVQISSEDLIWFSDRTPAFRFGDLNGLTQTISVRFDDSWKMHQFVLPTATSISVFLDDHSDRTKLRFVEIYLREKCRYFGAFEITDDFHIRYIPSGDIQMGDGILIVADRFSIQMAI